MMPSVLRHLTAVALVALVLFAIAAPSEAKSPLNACESACKKVERTCSKQCLDEAATCRQPCGCTEAPHTCTPAQRECHGICAHRMLACDNACNKAFTQCKAKC